MAESMLVVVVFKNGDRWSREVVPESNLKGWANAMLSIGRQLARNGWSDADIAALACFCGTHIGTYNTPGDIAEVLGYEG